LARRKDPISKYLKKARRYARHKRLRRYLILGAVVLLIIVAVALYFYFAG
jgi:t-SNARE complex subunit (syntaxin)